MDTTSIAETIGDERVNSSFLVLTTKLVRATVIDANPRAGDQNVSRE
jgi:hypothetical protein